MTIDTESLVTEATATHLLLDALRQRGQAKVMLTRLWPMISELRSALEPLDAEYSRWATKHYSAERRVAMLRKEIVTPHSTGRVKTPPREMSPEEATNFLASQSMAEKRRLLAELQALVTDD